MSRFPKYVVVLACAAAILSASALQASADKEALIAEALSAAIPDIAADATVMDWEMNVLKEGSNGYICLPTPPPMAARGKAPMCMDEPWMKWAAAWAGQQEFRADRVAISYMMAGDAGASNIDPYADGPTDDNDWVVETPHLMILVPDNAMLEGMSTDPQNGGPYVMWKGTPYAHIMVPVGDGN